MRRTVTALVVVTVACVSGACVFGDTAEAQVPPRRIALVYDLSLPPLFVATGEVAETAAFNVAGFLRRVRVLETDHSDERFALALRGVTCDELRLIGTTAADQAIAAIRRVARSHRILATTYTQTRLEHMGADTLARSIRDNAEAVERCAGTAPREPFLPPDASLPTSDAARALRDAGIDAVLSAYAVPPADPRPRIVPAVVIGPDADVPDLALARPEAPALTVLLDDNRLTLLGDLAADDRFEAVSLPSLADVDVIGGVIDPPVDLPRDYEDAIDLARDELAVFRSYTLPDNPMTPIYATVLARAESTAMWEELSEGTRVADDLEDALKAARGNIAASDGAITFTSRSGVVPITIANDTRYPIRVRIELTTAKMSFEGGSSRVVTVDPPGDTVVFRATALSTGTFPVKVAVFDPQYGLRLGDVKQVHVTSAAANLSALVITGSAALFLVYWMVSRFRRRRTET